MGVDRYEEIREQFEERRPAAPSFPIIGITGRKRHGKDTAAQALVQCGYTRLGFADELKRLALVLDPIVSPSAAPGPPFRLSQVVGDVGWERAKSLPEVRRILQVLGTDIVREVDSDHWVITLGDRIEDDHIQHAVIADVRFDNEARFIRTWGGVVLEIVRPDRAGVEDAHASEAGVSSSLVDAVIANDSTVGALHHRVLSTVAGLAAERSKP